MTYLPVCETRKKEVSCTEFKKTTENNVSDGLRRIVPFLIIAPYEYSYLLTYLLTTTFIKRLCSFGPKGAIQIRYYYYYYYFLTLGRYIPEGFKKLKNVT